MFVEKGESFVILLCAATVSQFYCYFFELKHDLITLIYWIDYGSS